MDLSKYFKTPLEQTIEDIYKESDLIKPSDLSIDNVAAVFGVDVLHGRLRAFSDNEQLVVFLRHGDSLQEQRKSFFHELGHVVRHAGDQRRMPELFRQMQEADADRFSMYAAIPFFMLEKSLLPAAEEEVAGKIATVFQVPPEFSLQRLRQIRERIAGEEFLAATFTYQAAAREERIPIQASSEPIIRGIYGLEDLSRPHTLVITQRGGFDWESPLHIEVDGYFKSVDSQPHSYRDGAVVRSGDLKIPRDRVGYVKIDMERVASRHGTTANRLFLPMEAVDDAINF